MPLPLDTKPRGKRASFLAIERRWEHCRREGLLGLERLGGEVPTVRVAAGGRYSLNLWYWGERVIQLNLIYSSVYVISNIEILSREFGCFGGVLDKMK